MSVFNVAFRSDVFLNIQVNTDYVCLLDVFCAVFLSLQWKKERQSENVYFTKTACRASPKYWLISAYCRHIDIFIFAIGQLRNCIV